MVMQGPLPIFTSPMDALTPKGQQALAIQEQAVRGFHALRPDLLFLPTNPRRPIPVDGLIARRSTGEIVAAVEVKARADMDVATLLDQRRGEWLLSYSKLEALAALSRLLGVPGIGWLVLPRDGILLAKRLTEAETGTLCPGIRVENTLTQTSCNQPALVERTNAFIDMTKAAVIELPMAENHPTDPRLGL